MQNENPLVEYDDEIDLRELFSVLWRGKILIAGITSVFAVVSVIFALLVPNQYQASTLLAPAQQDAGGIAGAMGQLGGLASLAGISLGDGEGNESQMAMEIMQSRNFIEDFIKNNGIEVEVFAADGWSAKTNQLSIDDSLYDIDTQTWVRNPPSGKPLKPTGWELYEKFIDVYAVTQDKKSGMINVSVEYYSPILAKEWSEKLVDAINSYMQARKLQQVNRNIQYLEAQIEKTAIADMRGVFYTIIEEQIKSKMLAEASPEYVFETVSPAMVPEEKSQPKRALICILGTLLGGMLSVLLILVRHYAFDNNKKIQ